MKDNKGFTLIELLVVVAIIGILAAVGTVAYQGYTAGAKKNATKSNHASVTKYIAAELAKCSMGEDLTMDDNYTCDTSLDGAKTVSAAAALALDDFKNTYTPSANAVADSSDLVLGQTSVSVNTAGDEVTIETCFDEVGADTPACASGDAKSTMKNTVDVE